jgi:C1A family cysteine protease
MIDVIRNFSSLLGAVRDQGKRPTCLAFAASDLNELANNAAASLSVEYVCHHAAKRSPTWGPAEGFTIDQILGAIQSPGQPIETAHPYQNNNELAPLMPVPIDLNPMYISCSTRDEMNSTDILKKLEAKVPVVLVVRVTESLFQPINGVVEYKSQIIPNSLHAVLAVGIGKHKVSGEQHVFIRNSWGHQWGQAGHAWISFQYLQTHLYDSFIF